MDKTDSSSVLSELKWATVTSSQTLTMMAHTGLNRLVPRGTLMATYGLPVVSGTSILLGSFDTRNNLSLSGNIVNSSGAILDLIKIMGMCGVSLSRDDIIARLEAELNQIENSNEITNHERERAAEIIRTYRKIAPMQTQKSYQKIENLLAHVVLDIPTSNNVQWNADEFFNETGSDFPVILASTTLFDDLKAATGSGCAYEFFAEKELVLGLNKDIQFIFVHQENLSKAQALLNRIIARNDNQPRLVALESVQLELFHQIGRVLAEVRQTWPTIDTNTAKERVKANPWTFDFLPAFATPQDPIRLGCTLAQTSEILKTVATLGLKPLCLFSPMVPSYPSFLWRAPHHAQASAEEISLKIATWISKLKASCQSISLEPERNATPDNIVIEIELGL